LSGEIFEALMSNNYQRVKAFNANTEFRKFIIDVYMTAQMEAERLGCSIEDLVVIDPKMSKDYKTIMFGLEIDPKLKDTGLLGADGLPIRRA